MIEAAGRQSYCNPSPLMCMVALPFFLHGPETACIESVQHFEEPSEHAAQHAAAVGHGAARRREIAGGLIDAARDFIAEAHVDTDADHDRARAERVALHLDEQPGDLAPLPKDVVGPFEARVLHADVL